MIEKKESLLNIRVAVYLVAVFLTLAPTIGAFFAVRSMMDSAISVGLDQRLVQQLDKASFRLKELAKKDPSNEKEYKDEFLDLQNVRQAYGLLVKLSPSMKTASIQLFFVIFGISVFGGLGIAWWLNGKIIRSYDAAISKLRKSQELADYLRSRESWRTFAQKLVHEVKNPLTPIQMMVGRLPNAFSQRPEKFPATLIETREMVDEEIQKVTTWLEAFAGYARLPEPSFQKVPLKTLIEDFTKKHENRWNNVKFRISSPELSVELDPILVQQVFYNLVKNAAEAAAPESVTVEFLVTASDDNCVIQICDDGPGIPPAVKEKLFQPYTSTKGEKGMGLGLAICQNIVRDHKGQIEILPIENKTCFQIEIPKSQQNSERKFG